MLQLDEWQEQALAHEGNLLLCTGRQVGKTTIMAIKAVEYMRKNKGARIIIASLTEDQAKLIIIMMQDYIDKNYKPYKKGIKKADKWTQNKVSLNNGSTAIARPVGNTGDAIRGFTGDVLILDEVSRFNEMILDASMPTLLTTGGQIWICSTPFGKKGFFWDSFQNHDKLWQVIHISSEDVIRERPISDSWTEEQRTKALAFLERQKLQLSKLKYGQEYLGLFMDDLNQFFPDELIQEVCTLSKPVTRNERCYLGVDIARLGGDDNSFQIISQYQGKFYHMESIVEKGKLTTETERDIISITSQFKCKKVGIDAGSGSLGVSVLDHLRETEIKRKVVPMNNRQLVIEETTINNKTREVKQRMLKEDLYDNLKSMMEHKEIKLLNDEKVRLSLKCVQYETILKHDQPTKIEIFSNPHSESHIVEALVRAAMLAKKDKTLNLWAASLSNA